MTENTFSTAVKTIIKQEEKMIITSGVVSKVKQHSFDVRREGMAELLDVRFHSVLIAVENEFKVIPKVGSVVLCGIIESDTSQYVLITCSEIEKVIVKIDQLEFECSNNGVKIENQNENFIDAFNDMFNLLNEIVVVQGNTLNIPKMKLVQKRMNKIFN